MWYIFWFQKFSIIFSIIYIFTSKDLGSTILLIKFSYIFEWVTRRPIASHRLCHRFACSPVSPLCHLIEWPKMLKAAKRTFKQAAENDWKEPKGDMRISRCACSQQKIFCGRVNFLSRSGSDFGHSRIAQHFWRWQSTGRGQSRLTEAGAVRCFQPNAAVYVIRGESLLCPRSKLTS